MNLKHGHLDFANTLILASVAMLLLSQPAVGQSPVPDFGRGFKHFQRLGLPDITDAEYVHIEREGHRYYGSMGRRGNDAIPGADGAWILNTIADDEVEVITHDQQRLTLISPEKWKAEWEQKLAEARQASEAGSHAMNVVMYGPTQGLDARIAGSWERADPIADGRKLITYIEALDTKANNDDEQPFIHSNRENPLKKEAGALLLTAANLYVRGGKAEANQLAQLLFAKGGGQQTVIEQAISLLADTQYSDHYRQFVETRDWQAYHAGMTALTTRFSKGWKRRDAILRVIPVVKRRIAGPAPAPEADGLGDIGLEMAAALAAPRTSDSKRNPLSRQYDSDLWILQPTTAANTNASTDAVTRIKERGIKSVPLLIALLEDTYPTEYDNPSGTIPMRNNSYSFSYHSSGPIPPQMKAKMAKQRANAFYASLPRPLTRGEIAEILLRQVIPLSDELRYQRHDQSPAETRQALKVAAERWVAEAKTKNTTELALEYLERETNSGYSQQRRAALMHLVDYGNAETFSEVERVLLDMDPMQASNMAIAYAEKRGENAKPFITNFVARLKAPEKPRSEDENAFFVARASRSGNEQWRKRMIKQFENLLSNATLADLLVSIREDDGNFRNQYQLLLKAAAKETPTNATAQLLDAAIATSNTTRRSQMINLIASLPYAWMTASTARRTGDAPPQPEMPAPSVHAERWQVLLDDERPAASQMRMSGVTTIGNQTAWILETFNTDPADLMHGRRDAQLYAMLPNQQMAPLLKRRAQRRLNGTPQAELPALPNADNIEPEALEKLITDLIATPPDALAERIADLSLDEHFAMIKETNEHPELREKLRPLANRINHVEIAVDDPDLQARLQALEKQPISKAIVEQLFNAVQTVATNQQISVIATLIRQAPSDGISLAFRSAVDQEDDMMMMYAYGMPGKQKPMITGTYSSGRANGFGRWKVKLPKPPAKQEAASPKVNRAKQLMKLLQSGAENMSAEVLAELESLSEDDIEEMEAAFDAVEVEDDTDFFGGNNKQFWKNVETIDQADSYASPLYLLFNYTQPEDDKTDGDAESDL